MGILDAPEKIPAGEIAGTLIEFKTVNNKTTGEEMMIIKFDTAIDEATMFFKESNKFDKKKLRTTLAGMAMNVQPEAFKDSEFRDTFINNRYLLKIDYYTSPKNGNEYMQVEVLRPLEDGEMPEEKVEFDDNEPWNEPEPKESEEEIGFD